MCLDFYTLDVRNLGQAEGAHKVGASMGSLKMRAFLGYKQRTSRKTTETLAFRVESEATKKVPLANIDLIDNMRYTENNKTLNKR